MALIAEGVVALIALIHVYILVLEMFLWDKPTGLRAFGLTPQQAADSKVLIINRLNLGGPTFNVAYLTKHLHPQVETLLVSGMIDNGEESSEFILDDLGVKPRYINNMYRDINPLKDLPAYRQLKQIIREYRPDIVHTHASKAGAVGRLAAIHCKVPVIVHTFHGHVFHSYFGKGKTFFFKSVERYLAQRSSAIITISDIQKKELTEVFNITDPKKTHVVPLGFDLERFTKNTEQKPKEFREKSKLVVDELAIGIIGRLAPIKNHELFIDAIEFVKKKTNKKIRAFIIGGGETQQQLENYLQSKDLPFTKLAESPSLFCFTSWIKNVDWALSGLEVVR